MSHIVIWAVWCCDKDSIPPGVVQSTTAATRVSSRKVSRCLPMLISLIWLNRDLQNNLMGLSGAIGTLATNVGLQGVGTKMEVYSGEPKGFKEWIKSIEKDTLLTNADDVQTKCIAYQASKDAVSDFVHCYITANPNSTWNQLKNELSARFSEIQDSQQAFTLLRQTKQKPNEKLQVYAKRLFALTQEAFAGQWGVLLQWKAK